MGCLFFICSLLSELFCFYENLIWKYSTTFTTFTTMEKKIVTIKVFEHTRAALNIISGLKNKSQIEVSEDLVNKELQKYYQKKLKQSNKK